jgi:glutamyl-tRNA reductase
VNRILHEPTVRLKELRDDRVHARMALIRDLFGLADDEGELPAASEDEAEQTGLAEVRELRQRRG